LGEPSSNNEGGDRNSAGFASWRFLISNHVVTEIADQVLLMSNPGSLSLAAVLAVSSRKIDAVEPLRRNIV
jgi:hypothetical protein